jgi:hypothetical protein
LKSDRKTRTGAGPGDPRPHHPIVKDGVLLERRGAAERAIVIGLGHVARHLGPLLAGLGFGVVVCDDGYGADRGDREGDAGQFDEPAEVFSWCGGGVLLRPSYLQQVGLFEETFFLYYEDTDLSWRGRAAGWRYEYVPGAIARHVHSASSGVGSALFMHYTERNRLLMLVRNAPWASGPPCSSCW